MGEYTNNLENQLYCAWDDFDNSDEDYSKLLEFLNGEKFRSFGDGLISFVNQHLTDEKELSLLQKLTSAYKKQGVPIPSRNTLKNWLEDGVRPKKSEDSRDKMFHFAFALQLNTEETANLFHKVYLDRAFYFRNPKELIYYYCLEKKLTFPHAASLIESIPLAESTKTDTTVYTASIEQSIHGLKSDDELLRYLSLHTHNFSVKNITAKELFRKALCAAKETMKIERYNDPLIEELAYNRERDSIDLLYDTILYQSSGCGNNNSSIFKNRILPQEIKNCFPQPTTFSKVEPTFEEIRKMLILLLSYSFWYRMGKTSLDIDIDDYVEEINATLFEAGLSPLYYGNPHDWLYLYCSLEPNALDRFRGIIAEIADNAED